MLKRKLPVFLSVGLFSLGLYAGCGQVKKQSDRTVTIESAPGASTSQAKKLSENVNGLVTLLSLYGDPSGDGSFNKEGLTHMVDKFKPEIEKFLSGSGLKIDQVVDLVFSFDKNKDNKISPEEIVSGIKSRVKSLSWTNGKDSLSRDQILEKITADYPKASKIAKEGLVNQLMLFDGELVEGNADGFLDSRELAIPALAMGVIENTDLSDGFKVPDNTISSDDAPTSAFYKKLPRLIEDQVNLKLKQQLVGRYNSLDPKNLSTSDSKLEWMQLSLRLMIASRAVEHMDWYSAETGAINLAQVRNLLTALGYSNVVNAPQFNLLALAYDSPLVGGKQDSKYNSIELFQLLTDIDFASRLKDSKLYQDKDAMALLYPKTSTDLFSDAQIARLNSLATADLADFTLEMNFVKLTDSVFNYYSTEQNGKIKKDNMLNVLLEADPRDAQKIYINAFFADAIPADCSKAPNYTKAIFETFKVRDELTPSETASRIRKVISYDLLCKNSSDTQTPEVAPSEGAPLSMKELRKKQREERKILRKTSVAQ